MNQAYRAFRSHLTKALAECTDDHDRVLAVSSALTPCVQDPEFIHDCIERVALTMQCGRSHWRNPAFDEDVDAGFLARMIFWPANFKSDVHRHNLWTVTSVLYNEIDVVIYDPEGANLISRFHGKKGAIGRVVPPCTHAAENNSTVPSVTLALFCRQTVKDRTGPEVEWITRTQESKYAAGGFDRALRAFVFMINENRCARSLELLDAVYALSKPSIKLLVTKAIAQIDPERAVRRLDEVIHEIESADDRSRVYEVRNELVSALTTG